MIAYNEQWLYDGYVRGEADEALREECITPAEHAAIYAAQPGGFYTPNFFVRIGMAMLTQSIVSSVGALFVLMSGVDHMAGFLVLMGLLSYGAAEFFIRTRRMYNAGVDNMLVWMAAAFIVGGISFQLHSVTYNAPSHNSLIYFIAFIVFLALAARFADMLLSIAAGVSLLLFALYAYMDHGILVSYTWPFVMILCSVGFYFGVLRLSRSNALLLYGRCLLAVRVLALLAIYAAGNYYLVHELTVDAYRVGDTYGGTTVAPAIKVFSWAWTFLVPVAYAVIGIRTKDVMAIRISIPLMAVAVLTFRYYHSVMPPEVAMLLAGVLLFMGSYLLINRLRKARGGFTFAPPKHTDDLTGMDNILTNELVNKAGNR